ncbi:MAG: four helix bundle protein [bacterium]
MYREIYSLSNKIPKRDKLGLHGIIEQTCIRMLSLSIESSLTKKADKWEIIRKIRIYVETLKYLIRTEFELNIIKREQYLSLEEKLQEISKEAVGWERYANKNSP